MGPIKRLFFLLLPFVFFLIAPVLLAGEIWSPSTIIIRFDGSVGHKIPLPLDYFQGNKPLGPAVGDKLGGGFFPVFGGNYQKFKRVFALEELNEKEDTVDGLRPVGKDQILLPAVHPRGYRVIEQHAKSLNLVGMVGAGPGGYLFLSAGLGAGFNVGNGFVASRTVKTLAESKRLPWPSIPGNIKELNKQLKPGDSLSWKQNINLIVNLSAGAGWLAGTGFCGGINTTWNTTIGRPQQFGNRPIVQVSYAKAKDKKVGGSFGNLLSNFSLTKVWGKSNSLTYIFDLGHRGKQDIELEMSLDDPRLKKLDQSYLGSLKDSFNKKVRGQKVKKLSFKGATALLAYNLALKGDLSVADILSQSKGKYGVTKVSDEDKKSVSRTKAVGFKIPWLIKAGYSSGKSFVVSDLKKINEHTVVETLNGIYSKKYGTSGVLSRDASRASVFSGFVQQVMPLNEGGDPESDHRRYAANWKYSYIRNKVNEKKIKRELKQVRYKIGFMDKLRGLNIPKGTNKTFKIEIDLSLSNKATDELMNIAKIHGEKKLVEEATIYLDTFVKEYRQDKYIDEKGYSIAKREICVGGGGHKVRILKECVFTTRNKIKKAMKKAYKGLMKMAKSKGNSDYKEFVKGYADFGKGFIENKFTMKTFLRLLRFKCRTSVYHKLIKERPYLSKEEVLKICPEKRIMVDGKLSKIPYEIKMKVQGTNIKPWSQTLYSHK